MNKTMGILGIVLLTATGCGGDDDDDSTGTDGGASADGSMMTTGGCAASCFPSCFTTPIGDCNGNGATSCISAIDTSNLQNIKSNVCFSNGFKISSAGLGPTIADFYKNGSKCNYTSESALTGTMITSITYKMGGSTFATWTNFDTNGKKFTINCTTGGTHMVDLSRSECSGCGGPTGSCTMGTCTAP